MTSVLCILQARMSSTRLPGKVLMPILGMPMIGRQIERIRRARRIDALVVATSDQASDDALAQYCAGIGVHCHRGSLDDVLDRYYRAAQPLAPQHVMRLTGDCPLTDPALLDRVVEQHLRENNDYTSNVHQRTYPDGLDTELFRFELLERAWHETRTPFEREHVTPYFYSTGPTFRRGAVIDSVDRAALRWTVDYPEDFEFVSRVFAALYPDQPDFGLDQICALLERHPELALINAHRA